jgi:hypothetical protein
VAVDLVGDCFQQYPAVDQRAVSSGLAVAHSQQTGEAHRDFGVRCPGLPLRAGAAALDALLGGGNQVRPDGLEKRLRVDQRRAQAMKCGQGAGVVEFDGDHQ